MGPAEAFERVWGLTVDVERALSGVFGCERDERVAHLEVFGTPGLGGGSLVARSGGLVAWLTHLRSGAPERGMAEAQLAVWLSPEVDVPHLRIGFGVLPELHWWLELLPRRDLSIDVQGLEQYHEAADDRRRRMLADDRFDDALRPGLRERALTPPSALHVRTQHPDQVMAIIETETWGAVEQWLGWIDAAPPIDPEEKPFLAERDAALRHLVSERDPVARSANTTFGTEIGTDVMRAIAGAL